MDGMPRQTIVLTRQRLEVLFRGEVAHCGSVAVRLPSADLTSVLDALSAEAERRDDVRHAFTIASHRMSEDPGRRRCRCCSFPKTAQA